MPGLRPTPDRVRETLFNWLAPVIGGSRCLDPFAGSGALGLEAASRGASSVTLLDKEASVIAALRRHVHTLGADNVEIRQQDGVQFLAQARGVYDVIFLDPPFGRNLLQSCLDAIDRNALLSEGGYLYLETEASLAEETLIPRLPGGCAILRRKRAGQVNYYLVGAGSGAG